MRIFFIFIYSFLTFLTTTCTSQTYPNIYLVISPVEHILEPGPPILFRKVDDFLNLTCRLVVDGNHEPLPNYNISWNWQFSTGGGNANRVMMMSLSENAADLVFKSLRETDSGEYTCKCPELDLTKSVRVKVRSFKRTCNEKMFVCPNGNCIAKLFLCDGKEDCKGGNDEDFEHCGLNPCEGKIPCDNGRCIPESWCCDEGRDPNCTTKHKPKCCHQSSRSYLNLEPSSSWDHQFGDMGFLQTTIYTVIGCAMAFMLIVTILVIAICRVHLKRTVISRCPLNHQHQHLRPGGPLRPGGLPLYDIDMFLDHRHQETHTGGLLVTYNINNGVQFVGRPIDPPPYCEIVDTPPREGPPPPYISQENIPQENQTVEESPEELINEDPVKPVEIPLEVISNLKPRVANLTHSMGDVSKYKQDSSGSNLNYCSSVPSVSGLINKNIKRSVFNDISDSESDSSCMENETLLNDFKSKSGVLSADSNSTSFMNNIAAVSKSLIGSLSNKSDVKKSVKQFRPLLTQKSFDSSDRVRKDFVLVGNENNFHKIVPNVTHSLGDLSPVNNDLNCEQFSGTRNFLTLPLRESFIGVRKDES